MAREKAQPKRSRLALIAAAVVLLVGGAGVGAFLYLTRDTSDPELRLSDDPAGTGAEVGAATLDGKWNVVPGRGDDATVAGYRVREVFAAGSRRATVDGRTNAVSGSLTVADGAVTKGTFTVDMTTLVSDEIRRDKAIRERGLQSDRFPEATFALTEPITLPDVADRRAFSAAATGDLTLHGRTRPVTIEVNGRSSGRTFTIQGSAPVTLTDYGIEPPSVSGVVAVEDQGIFEFIVNFARA